MTKLNKFAHRVLLTKVVINKVETGNLKLKILELRSCNAIIENFEHGRLLNKNFLIMLNNVIRLM